MLDATRSSSLYSSRTHETKRKKKSRSRSCYEHYLLLLLLLLTEKEKGERKRENRKRESDETSTERGRREGGRFMGEERWVGRKLDYRYKSLERAWFGRVRERWVTVSLSRSVIVLLLLLEDREGRQRSATKEV